MQMDWLEAIEKSKRNDSNFADYSIESSLTVFLYSIIFCKAKLPKGIIA